MIRFNFYLCLPAKSILIVFLECISFSAHGSDKGPEFHLGNVSQPSKQHLVHTYTVRRTLSGFGVSMMFYFIFRDLPELLISMFWKFFGVFFSCSSGSPQFRYSLFILTLISVVIYVPVTDAN